MILSTMKNIMASVTNTTGPPKVSSEVKQMCLQKKLLFYAIFGNSLYTNVVSECTAAESESPLQLL